MFVYTQIMMMMVVCWHKAYNNPYQRDNGRELEFRCNSKYKMNLDKGILGPNEKEIEEKGGCELIHPLFAIYKQDPLS